MPLNATRLQPLAWCAGIIGNMARGVGFLGLATGIVGAADAAERA